MPEKQTAALASHLFTQVAELKALSSNLDLARYPELGPLNGARQLFGLPGLTDNVEKLTYELAQHELREPLALLIADKAVELTNIVLNPQAIDSDPNTAAQQMQQLIRLLAA